MSLSNFIEIIFIIFSVILIILHIYDSAVTELKHDEALKNEILKKVDEKFLQVHSTGDSDENK